jgi:hypothetical protein
LRIASYSTLAVGTSLVALVALWELPNLALSVLLFVLQPLRLTATATATSRYDARTHDARRGLE